MPTIVPLTLEDEWLSRLMQLPLWTPPLIPTVVLAPHPDDETLGVGGMIAHLREEGVPVTVLALTDGENAYAESPGLGEIRISEQREALSRLGVPAASVHRLRLPDRDVALHEDRLSELLRPYLSKCVHLVAPWPQDFHPDHEATGRVAERVAAEFGLNLSFYLFWTWHRGTSELLRDQALVSFPLSESQSRKKLHALDAHASQFSHADGQPILSSELLKPARRMFEVFVQ